MLPYNAIGGGNAGFLKMLKCVRLLKLFRVFKQPRIMARIAARNTMRAGQQAVLKYIANAGYADPARRRLGQGGEGGVAVLLNKGDFCGNDERA